MLEALKSILLILSALFPIVNPLGGAPIFLTLTRNYSGRGRMKLSRKVAINSLLVLYRNAHSDVLRYFYPCGASGRRAYRDFEWLGDAQAER